LMALECFSAKKKSYSLAEIARVCKAPKSSIFRILKTLSELNYLKFDVARKEYSLGPRVLSLGFSALQSMEIREIARPYLKQLAQECQRTVNLAMLDRLEMVYIERIRYPDIRDVNINVGSRLAVYLSAAGRAVMAYMDPQQLQEMLIQLGEDPEAAKNIGPKGAHLMERLAEARRTGFAINNAEMFKSYRAIGVPIFSPEGVTCAINLVVSNEVSLARMKKEYAPKLIAAGREISKALGHQGDETRRG
jgi:IclR family transcriptional regulator, pca regulon regulatory protein